MNRHRETNEDASVKTESVGRNESQRNERKHFFLIKKSVEKNVAFNKNRNKNSTNDENENGGLTVTNGCTASGRNFFPFFGFCCCRCCCCCWNCLVFFLPKGKPSLFSSFFCCRPLVSGQRYPPGQLGRLYRVLPSFQGKPNRTCLEPHSTEFYRVFEMTITEICIENGRGWNRILPSFQREVNRTFLESCFTEFYRVLSSFTEFSGQPPGGPRSLGPLPSFALEMDAACAALPSFTEFLRPRPYCNLPVAGFGRVLPGFYRVLPFEWFWMSVADGQRPTGSDVATVSSSSWATHTQNNCNFTELPSLRDRYIELLPTGTHFWWLIRSYRAPQWSNHRFISISFPAIHLKRNESTLRDGRPWFCFPHRLHILWSLLWWHDRSTLIFGFEFFDFTEFFCLPGCFFCSRCPFIGRPLAVGDPTVQAALWLKQRRLFFLCLWLFAYSFVWKLLFVFCLCVCVCVCLLESLISRLPLFGSRFIRWARRHLRKLGSNDGKKNSVKKKKKQTPTCTKTGTFLCYLIIRWWMNIFFCKKKYTRTTTTDRNAMQPRKLGTNSVKTRCKSPSTSRHERHLQNENKKRKKKRKKNSVPRRRSSFTAGLRAVTDSVFRNAKKKEKRKRGATKEIWFENSNKKKLGNSTAAAPNPLMTTRL